VTLFHVPSRSQDLIVVMRFPPSSSALPGTLSASLLLLLATSASAGVDNPTPNNFLRRPYANAVVLGDYVYIDGGELSQLENGTYNGDHPSYAGM
jgi:hypothetical protein